MLAGSGDQLLTITGTGLIVASQVIEQTTTTTLSIASRDAGVLVATVPSSLTAAPGTLAFRVSNPAPGGGQTWGMSVSVRAVPSLTSVTPNSTAVNGAASLVLTGTNLSEGQWAYPIARFSCPSDDCQTTTSGPDGGTVTVSSKTLQAQQITMDSDTQWTMAVPASFLHHGVLRGRAGQQRPRPDRAVTLNLRRLAASAEAIASSSPASATP